MNIAIVGTRSFNDYEVLKKIIMARIKLCDINCVVSGGARGADTLAVKFAQEFSIEMIVHSAQWDKFGRSAGFIRNEDIISGADIVFAFWDGKSKGTAHSIGLAKSKRKKLFVYRIDTEEVTDE